MEQAKLPRQQKQSLPSRFKKGFTYLVNGGLQQIFYRIDQAGIKKGVDKMGIDKFVNQCALLAAGSGVLTGAGGFATMLIGVPVDVINLIAQQFRVTLAVTYHATGSYTIKFDDFIKVVSSSLKTDAGMAVTKNIMEDVAEKLLASVGSKTARRLIPVAGAVIGGSVNYFFIKRMADSLLIVEGKRA